MTNGQPMPNTTNQTVNNSGQKKILIVEDDFFMRDLYSIQANKAGYLVYTAEDGEVAWQQLISNQPDIVLLDIMLPKLDGISLLKKIKENENLSSTKVAIITNMEDPTKKEEARVLGAVDYLLKINYTPKMVIDRMAQHLS